jgi:hypothetical protein
MLGVSLIERPCRGAATEGIKLDAVFLYAGVSRFFPVEAMEEQTRDTTFTTNVKAHIS